MIFPNISLNSSMSLASTSLYLFTSVTPLLVFSQPNLAYSNVFKPLFSLVSLFLNVYSCQALYMDDTYLVRQKLLSPFYL